MFKIGSRIIHPRLLARGITAQPLISLVEPLQRISRPVEDRVVDHLPVEIHGGNPLSLRLLEHLDDPAGIRDPLRRRGKHLMNDPDLVGNEL
jgi:hypothetical protein